MIDVQHITKEFVTSKKYPGFKGAIKGLFVNEKVRKVAVDDISFHIDDGEIVGYIGSNGAGKSTTIKMMTGLLRPSKGHCIVNGIDPSEDRINNAKNIGAVFGQRTQLWWDLPLSETFSILKEIYSVSDEDFKQRMKFLNAVLGLEEFYMNSVRTLSLGQRMRADLGAALLHNPKVLYLDEPTIGLDLIVKDNIRAAVKEINEKSNTTVILTTHDIGDIEELCKRIMIIDAGKIIYDGSLADVKDKYGVNRKVCMEVEDINVIRNSSYLEEFHVGEEDLQTNIEKNNITFTFNKNKLNVSDIIGKVMTQSKVRDIQIQETELSEIVKSIYSKGM